MTTLALELREMREDDRHYVLSSWLRSYAAKGWDVRQHYTSRESMNDPEDAGLRLATNAARLNFYDDYAPIVRSLLRRSRVLIASPDVKTDIVAGWMAWEGNILHYFVTKPGFRRLKVATWMLQDFSQMPVVYTHRTTDLMLLGVPSAWEYRRFQIWPAEETAA